MFKVDYRVFDVTLRTTKLQWKAEKRKKKPLQNLPATVSPSVQMK